MIYIILLEALSFYLFYFIAFGFANSKEQGEKKSPPPSLCYGHSGISIYMGELRSAQLWEEGAGAQGQP